jgi:hypothetical protein
MAMTNLKMEFYKQGVVFQWTWRNQEEYRAAKAFLEKFLGYPASAVGEVDFFISRTRSNSMRSASFGESWRRANGIDPKLRRVAANTLPTRDAELTGRRSESRPRRV